MLQEKLGELKGQYVTSLAQSEAELKRVQTLRDELQKFLQDHREFENWLERSEKELENMHKRDSSPEALPALLKRQGSFSEDVISHKGDLRFVTISGQKVLDTENGLEEVKEPSAAGTLVKDKLKDAAERYSALHSKVEERFLAACQPSHNCGWFLGLTVRTSDTVNKLICRLTTGRMSYGC